MDIFNTALNKYLEHTCDVEPVLLQEIKRETFLSEVRPNMLSGHYQGRLLSLFSKMLCPKVILELGTFTGYATLCLAEGLPSDGIIHTVDIDEELEDKVRQYFDASPYGNQIISHIGDAAEIISDIPGNFDLVFIDADKKNNFSYFNAVIDRVPQGGIILIDNVLWKGKIFDENPDKRSKSFLELNEKIAADLRVEKLILPVRDGLFVLRKK
ncbi:MAG TPA: O-methyltransferase [Sphingobacterium sp.]|nr:O-methyltransferase [Sphingobacterium sp.]